MKPWRDLKTVALPHHMRNLPRDPRGYPIPWVAIDRNGKADFRVLDTAKVAQAYTQCLCSICGRKMHQGEYAFVGGPLSMANRLFNDPAMHPDCAEYALQVCPFLAAPKFGYSKAIGAEDHLIAGMAETRPDKFGLGLTQHYGCLEFQGETYIHAEPFYNLTWWQHGQRI